MPIELTPRARVIITLVLLTIYAAPTFWVAVVAFDIPVTLFNPPPQEESYSVVIPLVVTNRLFQDILLGLTFTYKTAIVEGEPIRIQGTAELATPSAQNFTGLFVYFQDGLYYPSSSNRNIPFIGQLFLTHHTGNPPSILDGNATFYWNHAGTFSPYVLGLLKSNSTFDFGLIAYEQIQVVPRETLTEIQTNKINLVLTYAIFIMTAIGLASTVIELWTTEPSQSH